MSELLLNELKEKIADNYDPDLVVEILEISTEELLDAFEDRLVEKQYRFRDLFPEDGDE